MRKLGQAPSDHPEFAEFLVAHGISSISVTPDTFLDVKEHIARAERGLGGKEGREEQDATCENARA